MKTKNTKSIINAVITASETKQQEAEILHQFEYKGRLWIVHNMYCDNQFVVSDYITGLEICKSPASKDEAIRLAKKLLRYYTYAEVEERICKKAEGLNITIFNKI